MRADLRKDGFVVAIDFQEKLMPAMHEEQKLIETSAKLIKGAKALDMPVVVTTQYAKGLGNTVAKVAEALGDFEPIDKNTFSCCLNEEFMTKVNSLAKKVAIVSGAEAHICVLQTALDLKDRGYEVYVVTDCIDSRDPLNKKMAIKRMEQEGIKIATYEMVLYEAARGAKEPGFKEISAIVK